MLPAEEAIADFLLPQPLSTLPTATFLVLLCVCFFSLLQKQNKTKQLFELGNNPNEVLLGFELLLKKSPNQFFVCSWKAQLISTVMPICIYADFNQISNWAGYYRKVSRGLNYFWAVTLNLLDQILFRSCSFFVVPLSWSISCSTDHNLCLVSDLYVYAVFVCSIGIISVLLFTLVILCQSLLNKRRSTGEWNAILDDCRALAKKGGQGERRRECRESRKNKYFLTLIVILIKISRKRKILPAKLEHRHFLPFK